MFFKKAWILFQSASYADSLAVALGLDVRRYADIPMSASRCGGKTIDNHHIA